MTDPVLCLFDDAAARRWRPFALTRPVGELLLGAHTFRERAERIFGTVCAGHIAATHLTGFDEAGCAPVIEAAVVPTDRPRLFLSSRALLDWTAPPDLPDSAAWLGVAGTIAGRYVPAGDANPDPSWFEAPAADNGDDVVALQARILEHPWELIALNADRITRDFEAAATSGDAPAAAHARDPAGPGWIGYRKGMLRTGQDVTIEPGVVLDFTQGPIWLADGVTVRAFTRLAGPAWIGTGTTILGGTLSGVSIGPACKVRGEVEETVILGYSNKAHDGFLGHAYLGRWVNLGAMTTNSDLKNNYGTVRVQSADVEVDTGMMKLGCLLGDHVKTAIGALLNTGTIVGAGSNLFGAAMPPKYVPPFSWGSGTDAVYDVDRFLGVASIVMERRGITLTDGLRRALAASWEVARAERPQ
jgi:UDP-N-acetylglucosamine diphosphorylase / glucose-1-phosphate thymidylyltransferase / UDP-N-acetylgalactosamine diphosphorylase / glucosamine-1-phosphate N-acetyltransferase / galactosamine-1-phosphate N-acetyltransferase